MTMKLSRKTLDQIDSNLVQRINEIYHDLEAKRYEQRHKEMYVVEKRFWQGLADKYFVTDEPLVCLDYGTGTGLVPSVIGPLIKAEDTFVCADISVEMLKECERNVKACSCLCKLEFLKISGPRIPLSDHSVDVITMNSVLHHILDLKVFSEECTRALKPNGLLIASHEPNSSRHLGKPRNFFYKLAEMSPFAEKIMRSVLSKVSPRWKLRNEMLLEIAEQLKKEGLIDYNLRGTEIQQIVDIHTHTGFNRESVISDIFPEFEMVESEVYNDGINLRFVLSVKNK